MINKSVKTILAISIIASLAAPALAASNGKALAAPKIEIVTEDVDLGEIEKDKLFDYKIEVRNMGTEDLRINNVWSSCGCLAVVDERWPNTASPGEGVTIAPIHVAPAESIFILAQVDTNKISGQFDKSVHVISSDPDTPDATWSIRGIVLDLSAFGETRSNNINDTISFERSERSERSREAKDVTTVMVFHSLGCKDCRRIMEEFLPRLEKKYAEKMFIVTYNIDEPNAFAFLLDLQNKHDKRFKKTFFNPKPPTIFVDGVLLYGVKEIEKRLEKLIK